jgi:hypothetical protein
MFACGERAERIWIKAVRKVEVLAGAVIVILVTP